MHDPNYTEMLNAIHAKNATTIGSAILNMAYDDATANTYSTLELKYNAVSMMRRARCMQYR